MSGRSRSVRSRVGRLESARARGGGACRVCGGRGYPGLFVRRGEGGTLRRVGTSGCAGCGRVSVGKVIVLAAAAADGWAGGGDDQGAPR